MNPNPFTPSPRDYPEDAVSDPDNGAYNHVCIVCHNVFVANKRRPNVCKVCTTKDEEESKRRADWLNQHGAPANWVIMTVEEMTTIKADLVHLFWHQSELIRAVEQLNFLDLGCVQAPKVMETVAMALGKARLSRVK